MYSPLCSNAVLGVTSANYISDGVTLSCEKNILTPVFFPPRTIKKTGAATTSHEKIAVDNFFSESPIIPRSFLRAARYHDRYHGRDTRPRIRRFWKIKFIAFTARAATLHNRASTDETQKVYYQRWLTPVVGADIIFTRARASSARASTNTVNMFWTGRTEFPHVDS